MVYAVVDGRIGNNLFQIAAAASLAFDNNTDYAVIPSDYYTPDACFLADYLKKIEHNILRKVPILRECPANLHLYKEKGFSYTPIPYENNILLKGFFQSEKYFNPTVVRQLFEIDNRTKEYIEQKYGHLFKEEITSIHVRRGDYLSSTDQFAVCTFHYFQKAIQHIGEKKKFLITSDQIDWCKKKFLGENFFFSEGESPIVDMYLQSLCNNNIMSNSSFSWWGAWLNKNPQKIVISPYPWFGIAYHQKDTRDLLPEGWITIKNTTPLYFRIRGYFIWWKKRGDYFFRSRILNRIRGES